VALGFFYREPSATGSYYWLPAPLGWKLAYAGNTKTVEMYILFAVKIHRSTIPTVARPQLAGSREPVTRAK
jgi:hypothetical protein